jgi:RND family efflux transporter MFP subunit
MTMQDERDFRLHSEEDAREHEPGLVNSDAPTTSRGSIPGREPERSQGGGGERRDPALGRRRKRALVLASVSLLLGVGGLVGYGVYQRSQRNQLAQRELQNRQTRVPELRIEKVRLVDAPSEIHQPATTQAFDAATIFARQSGYIDKRLADIGSRVKSGDLLAIISAPEVDDQLNQARAQLQQMQSSLEQAQASRQIANVTNQRTAPLVQQGWETKQTGDVNRLNLAAQNAAVDVAKSNIQAQKAQIARLERAQSYERVVAPFDGVITQRNIDIGSLVTADATSGTSMFAIARDKVLRMVVFVPQDAALRLKPGMAATLDVPDLPGRSFKGKVARTANALDPNTRTLRVEADIENPDRTLSPGLYGTAHFLIPRPSPAVMVPSSALIFDQHGLQVATFADGVARLQKVSIGEDNGAVVQIATGLKAGEELIVNPPAGLADGARVTPAAQKKPVQEAKR